MNPNRKVLSALAGTILATVYTMASAQNSPSQTAQTQSVQQQGSAGATGTANAAGMPGSSGASSGGQAKAGADAVTVTVPMVVLIPIEAQSDQLNNGCWVRLTDKDAMPKKGNDILTIVGRMYMPSLETPTGVNWSRKADSLTVGPNAKVKVYGDPFYKGVSATLAGGQQVSDLNKQLGFARSIDSMQVECTG